MKQVNLFISSTFNDFTEERDVLHTKVFPRLEKYCMANGCSFHPVDLRWGISTEADNDDSTLDICLREVRRCRHLTPRPSFILLAGDRYGWRPLPGTIPLGLGQRILDALDDEERAAFARAYRVDENADPAEYRLVRAEHDEAVGRLLRKAAARPGMSREEREALTASATHRELLEAMSAGDFPDSAVCAVRTLENVRPDQFSLYYDTDGEGRPDRESREAAGEMKDLVRAGCRALVEYTLDLAASEAEKEAALEDFAGRVSQQLEAYLEKEFSLEGKSEEQAEAAIHAGHAAALERTFCGRERFLSEAARLVGGPEGTRRVLVIHGAEAAGKTALMARLFMRLPGTAVRFVGLTGGSLDEKRFLRSLEADREARTLLVDDIGKASHPRRLVRRLLEDDPGRNLVLSMDTALYEQLKKDLPAGTEGMELPPPERGEAEMILRLRLALQNRRVTPEQEQAVLEGYERTRDTHFLAALIDRAAALASFDGDTALRKYGNRASLYEGLLEDMTEHMGFGRETVIRMAGYLLASREGLSDKELYELMSRDGQVRAEFERTSVHALPGADFFLPYAVFSRVFHALRPLLAECYSEGETVWRFGTELAAKAAEKYCAALPAEELHSASADYWLGIRDTFLADSLMLHLISLNRENSAPPSRFVCEAPFQLMKAGRTEDLFRLLPEPGFFAFIHRSGFEDYLQYWSYVEEHSAHTIPEGFDALIRRAEAAAESGGTLDDEDIGPAIRLTDLLTARGGYGETVVLLSRARQGSVKEDDSIERIQPVCSEIQAMLDSGKNREALDRAEAFFGEIPKKPSLAYCTLLNTYGQALYRCGIYERALEVFREYHALAVQLGSRDHGFSSLKWIASCEKALMRLDRAMEIYEQLEADYGEDDRLTDLIPIYFEAGVTGFLRGGGYKKSKQYFDRCETLCLKLGNRSWLLEIYKIELNFFSIAREPGEILKTFPKYLEYYRLNAPGRKIPLDYLEIYARVCVNQYSDGDPRVPEKLEILHMLENYPFMERCGGLTREILEENAAGCSMPEALIQCWEFVIGTMPEPLRDYIMHLPPEPEYYFREMERAVRECYGPQRAEQEEDFAVRLRGGQLTEQEEEHSFGHRMLLAFSMYHAYSIFDRISEGGREDPENINYFSYCLLFHMQSIYQWLKENTYYAEYRCRQKQIRDLEEKRKASEEEVQKRKAPDEDAIRAMDKKVQAALREERGEEKEKTDRQEKTETVQPPAAPREPEEPAEKEKPEAEPPEKKEEPPRRQGFLARIRNRLKKQ